MSELIYPDVLTRFPLKTKSIYLSFDDGPDPVITTALLDLLDDKNVKATFFCLGKNVEEHRNIFERIVKSGHTVGSHGYLHLNAWKTKHCEYIENINKTRSIIPGPLLRPPYGKLRKKTYDVLKNDYRIVLWSLLSFDYVNGIDPQQCLEHLYAHTAPGDIVVFHDNGKLKSDLVTVVAEYIDFCKNKGMALKAIQ